VFPGGLTYSGHPLAAASIVAAQEAMADEGVIENARRIGEEVIGPRLRTLAEESPLVGEVRGRGVFWAVELVADPATREPVATSRVGAIKAAMLERGVLGFVAENRVHVVPPAVIGDADAHRGLDVLVDVLQAEAARG
jgi:taurine--2-oxoglutarate transaminase